jgi:hypothetical protein
VEYNWHAPELSRLEAVLARGDRRLCNVIAEAVRNGAKLDGWDEYFKYDVWLKAFETCGIDPNDYTTRGFGETEVLPWDRISVGVRKEYLLQERRQAYRSEITPDCRAKCMGCGASQLYLEGKCDE